MIRALTTRILTRPRWFSHNAGVDAGADSGHLDDFYEQEAMSQLPRLFPERRPAAQQRPSSTPSQTEGSPRERTPVVPAKMPELKGESEVDRHIRAHNSSMFNLKGQEIVGRVVAVGRKDVLVDLGWKDYQVFFKNELTLSQIYRHTSNPTEDKKRELQPGDELRFRIEEVGTPHGEIFVSTQKMRADVRKRLVWDELREAFRKGNPVTGRVLNPCNAGYAVGIAGFVAFCPLSRMGPETARNIGVLQSFMVEEVAEEVGQNLIVSDLKVRHVGRPARPRGSFLRSPYLF